MRNPLNIDHGHSQAICQEIGERLRAYLNGEPELPASLRNQIDQLRLYMAMAKRLIVALSLPART